MVDKDSWDMGMKATNNDLNGPWTLSIIPDLTINSPTSAGEKSPTKDGHSILGFVAICTCIFIYKHWLDKSLDNHVVHSNPVIYTYLYYKAQPRLWTGCLNRMLSMCICTQGTKSQKYGQDLLRLSLRIPKNFLVPSQILQINPNQSKSTKKKKLLRFPNLFEHHGPSATVSQGSQTDASRWMLVVSLEIRFAMPKSMTWMTPLSDIDPKNHRWNKYLQTPLPKSP